MSLTVLGNSDVKSLLISLTRDEILQLQKNLAGALHEYSIGNQDSGCAAEYQPQRSTITRQNDVTTLFMPASTSKNIGYKIMSVPGAPLGERMLRAPKRRSLQLQSSSSMSSAVSSSRDSVSSTNSDVESRSNSSSTNIPATNLANVPLPEYAVQSTSPVGSLTLLDSNGKPTGLVNAPELTAFRTALMSLMLFNRRKKVSTITVFGAGRQAYWHIRLALVLRGKEIKRVNIFNRSFDRATQLLREFYSSDHQEWRSDVKFSAVSSEFGEYDRLLNEGVRKSDVIFCCTPSIDPLFPAQLLLSGDGRKKGRFISAIGSFTPNMTELHPDVLRDAVELHKHSRPHRRHARRSGVVIVDSLESCLREAGEIVQAELKPHQLVEIGELIMMKTESLEKGEEVDKGLAEWIQKGNVIYKSVGLGLTDVVVGGDVVRLATERGVGTTIPNF